MIQFRPEMADMIRRLHAFLVKGSPTICLTATINEEEIASINQMMGYSEPAVVLAASPLLYSLVQYSSSQVSVVQHTS